MNDFFSEIEDSPEEIFDLDNPESHCYDDYVTEGDDDESWNEYLDSSYDY